MGADRLAGQAPVETTGRIRAFFAVPVPAGNRERLGHFLERCSAVAPEFRWGDPSNLHLTVRFIGQVDLALVEGIASEIERAPGPAFEVALGGLGTFKSRRLARVVWLGMREGAEPLAALAGRVEELCTAAGLEAETRAFKAHLTLARARERDGAVLPPLPELPELEPWRAEELVLYWSHLGRGGAVHEPLRRIRLLD